MKTVSVIVPVYKVEQYIASTITSVLQQTYKQLELLIIDDESPDRSIEICQQFKDPRIKIIHQKNRGLAGARNTGIKHSIGEYIAFLDGDDLWLPEKLEKHIEHLENSPTVGISFSRSAFIDAEGNLLGTYQMPKLTGINTSHILCRNPIGNGSSAVIRQEVFEGDFYFDENFRQSEDIEFWIRMAIQTPWKIEGIADALTLYRVNPQGLSANWQEQLEAWERVIEKTRSYAPELIAKWEDRARAYQLRYLARRAVTLRTGSMAVDLLHKALTSYWRILLEEPRRTLLTCAAAYSLMCLPSSFYDQMEALALHTTGDAQKRRIDRDQSGQLV